MENLFPKSDRMITPNADCGSTTYVVLAQEDAPEKRWFIACQTTNVMRAVSKRDEYAREAFPVRMVEVTGR